MAAAAATPSTLECPVCHDDYDDPKMLPCAHLVCKTCVLSWLGKEGSQGGCPLCREPILTPTQPGQADLATRVKALPSDLGLQALVRSHKVLQEADVCGMCDSNVSATSHCLQCDIKLCKACVRSHNKLPVTVNHEIEDLDKLSVERMAATNRSMCETHSGRLAELFCLVHQQLVCVLCGTTSHGNCPGKQTIGDAAKDKRKDITQLVGRIEGKEKVLATEIKKTKDGLKAMRQRAQAIFDDLQQCLDRQRQKVQQQIQAEEDRCLTSLAPRDTHRDVLARNAAAVRHMVHTAPDGAFLHMVTGLKTRLDELKARAVTAGNVGSVTRPDLTFDPQTLSSLKAGIAKLGCVGEPQPTVTPAKPRGVEMAKILKKRDRVKRGRDWCRGNEDGIPPGEGTVVRVNKGQGFVMVRWDAGGQNNYNMGRDDCYELALA